MHINQQINHILLVDGKYFTSDNYGLQIPEIYAKLKSSDENYYLSTCNDERNLHLMDNHNCLLAKVQHIDSNVVDMLMCQTTYVYKILNTKIK